MAKPPYDPDALPPDLRKLIPQDYSRPVTEKDFMVSPHCSTTPVKQKSSAQVETLVSPRVVSPKSGGLKPGRQRPYRLMGRFSEEERDTVLSKAEEACLSVNEFIRISTLGANYASSLDPELRQRFIAVHKELCRHGVELNRIANQLTSGLASPEEGASLLAMITRSLLAAHTSVRTDLASGLTYDDSC